MDEQKKQGNRLFRHLFPSFYYSVATWLYTSQKEVCEVQNRSQIFRNAPVFFRGRHWLSDCVRYVLDTLSLFFKAFCMLGSKLLPFSGSLRSSCTYNVTSTRYMKHTINARLGFVPMCCFLFASVYHKAPSLRSTGKLVSRHVMNIVFMKVSMQMMQLVALFKNCFWREDPSSS